MIGLLLSGLSYLDSSYRSRDSFPPRAHWTPEGRESMSTLDMPSHLNYINSFVRAVLPLVGPFFPSSGTGQDKQLIQLIRKRLEVHRFLLQGNSTLILSSLCRNVITGEQTRLGADW